MTPQAMADIHAAAFPASRSWGAEEIASLIESPLVTVLPHMYGFAIVRTIAQEAELLTIAVLPWAQRMGAGHSLMQNWLGSTQAHEAFLEVAADNAPAMSLYMRHGFAEVARRNAYYKRSDGTSVDAIVMRAALPLRHGASIPL